MSRDHDGFLITLILLILWGWFFAPMRHAAQVYRAHKLRHRMRMLERKYREIQRLDDKAQRRASQAPPQGGEKG